MALDVAIVHNKLLKIFNLSFSFTQPDQTDVSTQAKESSVRQSHPGARVVSERIIHLRGSPSHTSYIES